MKPYKNITNSSGFTLIELVITIVIGAIILMPTSFVVLEATRNSLLPEHFTKASSLLNGEIERITNRRFGAIVAEGPINYTGNFSNYAYEVSFYYVNGSDLNTSVGGPTDYKRVTVTVSHANFPNVSTVTLVTNN